jgi:hypothetical protein
MSVNCHMRMEDCLINVPANLDAGCLGPYPNVSMIVPSENMWPQVLNACDNYTLLRYSSRPTSSLLLLSCINSRIQHAVKFDHLVTIKGFSPRKDSQRRQRGSCRSLKRPCIRSHRESRVSCCGSRLTIGESDINPHAPHSSVAYSARASNRSRCPYILHNQPFWSAPPWTPFASAKPATRHPPTPTAARPRRSSWWYVSPSYIPSFAT